MTRDRQKRYLVETYGCQMNERDTENLAGMLEKLGYTPSNTNSQADIIILNTCSVRESAENKIWGRIGELTHVKSKNPEVILGICGCMSQKRETAERIRRIAPHMDLIFGTHNLHQLPELLEKVQASRKPVLDIWESEGGIIENLPTRREKGFKAFVSIMYGCNNFCTYCIVPYVRGRERSRQVADIKAEVAALKAEGYREVTLLGQNVNSYGKDLQPPVDFATLLEELNTADGPDRLRFTTSHPKDLSARLIKAIAECEKVCEHIHLPVQSGSNRILAAMNRRYTREDYFDLITALRLAVPNIAVTTDIIVGFPGETEEDFAATMDLVRQVRFDAAFTFVYNKRSGTPAAELNNQVPDTVKSSRIQQLIDLQNSITLANNRAEIGRTAEVLVEGPNKNNPQRMSGRARSNKVVVFDSPTDLTGTIAAVKIVDAKTWHLEGKLI